jgi:hypothetical protein
LLHIKDSNIQTNLDELELCLYLEDAHHEQKLDATIFLLAPVPIQTHNA